MTFRGTSCELAAMATRTYDVLGDHGPRDEEMTWTCSRSARPSTYAARRPRPGSTPWPMPSPGTTRWSSNAAARRSPWTFPTTWTSRSRSSSATTTSWRSSSPGELGPELVGGLLRADDPHREELGPAAVGVAQGTPGAVDLVLAGRTAHLKGRLGETEHAAGADRVGGEHAAAHVDRHPAVQRGRTRLGELPAVALRGEAEALQPHRL